MTDTTKNQADRSFFVVAKDANTGHISRVAIPANVQIGLQGNPAELQLLGRLSLATKDHSVTRSNQGTLNITNDDTIVSVTLVSTPTSGRITLRLPANPRDGQLHFIKDMSGTANTVPIDIIPNDGVLIDQYDSKTLTDNYGSIALYWFGDRWRVLVSGVGLIGLGAAPTDATYITLTNNTSLSNERRLTVSGTNLTLTDNGSDSTVSLNLSQILGLGAGTFTYSTITADSYGRIIAISSGTPPPSVSASYITVTNEPGLSAERALGVGTGLTLQDGGANAGITVGINNGIIATLTGSNFTGPVTFSGGLSGSLQRTYAGLPYMLAGSNITITTQSNGQVIIASTTSDSWTDNGTSLTTTSSVSIDGQGVLPGSIGADTYFYVSGTIGVVSGSANARRVSVFGGDVRVSGSLTVGTGSVTITSNDVQFGQGTRIERQGADLKFFDVTNPSGQTLSSLIGGGSSMLTASNNIPQPIFQKFTGSISGLTGSSTSWTVLFNQPFTVTGSSSLVDLYSSFGWTKATATGTGYLRIVLDGVELIRNGESATTGFVNASALVTSTTASAGAHTASLQVSVDTTGLDLTPLSTPRHHATLLIQEKPSSIYARPVQLTSTAILAGTVSTNTSHVNDKLSLGMMYFNYPLMNPGNTGQFYFRAIVDTTSTEPNMSASVDLYDVNGIVRYPPGTITGSLMSSSSPTSTQIQANLTSLLTSITGSGIFEARLWRTVSGSLTSSVACRSARLDVEFT